MNTLMVIMNVITHSPPDTSAAGIHQYTNELKIIIQDLLVRPALCTSLPRQHLVGLIKRMWGKAADWIAGMQLDYMETFILCRAVCSTSKPLKQEAQSQSTET